MTKLIQWAIENAPAIDRKVLSDLVNMLVEDKAERFASALIGIVNLDEVLSTLPRRIESYETKSNLVLLSANYLDDQVEYTCDETVTRYFSSQDAADEFQKSGRGRYDGNSRQTTDYTYPASHVYHDQKGYCSFASWRAMDKKQE